MDAGSRSGTNQNWGHCRFLFGQVFFFFLNKPSRTFKQFIKSAARAKWTSCSNKKKFIERKFFFASLLYSIVVRSLGLCYSIGFIHSEFVLLLCVRWSLMCVLPVLLLLSLFGFCFVRSKGMFEYYKNIIFWWVFWNIMKYERFYR